MDFSLLAGCVWLFLRVDAKWWAYPLLWLAAIEVGYQLKGSIGKNFAGLRIPAKNRFQHYFRETIGKVASIVLFGIGFFMILSKERLALHDYMAKTKVVRITTSAPWRQASVAALLVFSVVTAGYLFSHERESGQHSQKPREPQSLSSLVAEMPAVATLYVYNSRGKAIGQGSGFLITKDGVGVTNYHVIRDAVLADVKLGDGRLYHLLSVHAYDEDRDIAIFQVGRKTSKGIENAKDLPYLRLAAEGARIGDHIATIGSPEGLSNSVSDGLVSSIRGVGDEEVLQITAPISPGSSGGPVFNLKGEVVAITSFQFTEGQNLNFAVPINEVSKIKNLRAALPLESFHRMLRFTNTASATGRINVERTDSSPSRGLWNGMFIGTVHNAYVTDNSVVILKENAGAIEGCFGVREPLFGSGPLQGSAQNNVILFDVTTPAYHLHFEGRRSGTQVSGTYRALPHGGIQQQGEFLFARQDSKRYFKNFDPRTDCPTDSEMNRRD